MVADRVAQRVAGRGVSRAAVDAAVDSVLGALESRREAGADMQSSGSAAVTVAAPALIAAVTARSLPDLASRLRAALDREGVTVGPIGIAAAGLHYVATLELAGSARQALATAATALGAQFSIVGEATD